MEMNAIWEKSEVEWQEGFDRCAFCNELTELEELQDGLCQRCFGEIQELPETVRVDSDLDDLSDLYFTD
jgi:hypothetical protein